MSTRVKTGVREVLGPPDEPVAQRPASLRIEMRGGGRIAAVEATAPLDLKVTVLGDAGPVAVVDADVVLSSSGKLSGGDVTLPATEFANGVHTAATVQFTEPANTVTLTARCGDVSSVSTSFAVLPALVKGTGRGPLVENKNLIQDKTRKARAVLLAPPRDPASEALASLRANRPVAGLNSASKNSPGAEQLGASRQGDAGSNCLCCTLGAITGKSTTKLVHDMMRHKLEPDVRAGLDASWQGKDKELVDAEVQRQLDALIQEFGTMQDEKIWWRLESLKNFKTDVSQDGAGPTDDEQGDAQLRGTRNLLVAEARRRNKEPGNGSIRYKVVQDGLSDTDPEKKSKTYSLLTGELQQQMGKYPDGTQFQVFIFGPQMQHWLYAEKYNGKVVMEDYQKSRPQTVMPKAAASGATGYTDGDVPHHPVEKEQPGVFEQGYFLALCPESFDASQAWAGNSDWPQVTM